MQRFRVDLKTFLGLAMPNQCCHAITKLILGWFFKWDFRSKKIPNLWCELILNDNLLCHHKFIIGNKAKKIHSLIHILLQLHFLFILHKHLLYLINIRLNSIWPNICIYFDEFYVCSNLHSSMWCGPCLSLFMIKAHMNIHSWGM